MTDLLTRHLDAVFGYLALRLHPDRALAQDLCQEVFRAALARRQELRTPAAARAWLLGIARNRLADHFRARGLATVDLSGQELAPSEVDGRLERAALVAATLRQLPDEQRELLERKYFEGASVRALAADRNTSEKATESALARAREAFRKTYAELEARQERA